MPRGGTETFGDGLYRLIQEVGRLKMAPDADMDFLSSMEDMIISRYKQSTPTGAPSPPEEGQMAPPPTPPEGLSRGPTPSPDLSGATAELERIYAGS